MAPNPPTGNPPPQGTYNLVVEISNSIRSCHSPSAFPINPIISRPKSKLSESDAESIADDGASSSRIQKKNTKTKKGVKRKLCFEEMSKHTGKGNAAAAKGASARKRKLREFGDETDAENRRLERKRKLYLSLIGEGDYYDDVSTIGAAKAKEMTKTNTEKWEDEVSSKPLECKSLELSMMASNNKAKQSDKAHGDGVTLGLASKEANVKEQKLNGGGSGIAATAAADGVMALEVPSMGPCVKKEKLNELRDNNKAANETTKRENKVGVANGEKEHFSLIGKRVRGVKTKHLKKQKRTGMWEGPVFSKPCNFQSLELSRQANNVDTEDERPEQSDKAGGCSITLCLPSKGLSGERQVNDCYGFVAAAGNDGEQDKVKQLAGGCSITLCLPSKGLSAKRQVNGGYGFVAAAGNDGEKDKVKQLGYENEAVDERLKSKEKDKEYLSLIGVGDLRNDMSMNGRAKAKELKKKKKKNMQKLEGTAFSKTPEYKSLGLSNKCCKANASNENVKQSDKVNDGVIRYGLRSKGPRVKNLEGEGLVYKSEDVNGRRLESQEKIEVMHDWKEYFSSIGGGDLWKNTSVIGSAMGKDLKGKSKQLRIAELELFVQRTDLISKTAAAVIDAIKSSLC